MHDDNHKIMGATWSTWMRCHVDISTIENGGSWQQTIQWEPVVASTCLERVLLSVHNH